jgi:hypothetical protein
MRKERRMRTIAELRRRTPHFSMVEKVLDEEGYVIVPKGRSSAVEEGQCWSSETKAR